MDDGTAVSTALDRCGNKMHTGMMPEYRGPAMTRTKHRCPDGTEVYKLNSGYICAGRGHAAHKQ